MICPILKRFATDPSAHTECPGVDCVLPHRCMWARWHMLDPITGKPDLRVDRGTTQVLSGCAVRAEIQREDAQGDLFGE